MTKAAACLVAAFGIWSSQARAETTLNDVADLYLSSWVPCANGGAGETVELTGRIHFLVSYTVNDAGFSGYQHSQPMDVSGVGQDTGVVYRGVGVTMTSFRSSMLNGQSNMTFVNNFRLVAPGTGNNYLVHETTHLTVNADGSWTVYHDDLSIECR